MLKKLAVVLLITIFWSCTTLDPNQDPNPSYSPDGRYGEYISDTLYAVDDLVVRDDYPVTGFTNKLSVGNLGGLSAGFLINFLDLPADTVEIDSVFIKFTTVNAFGNESAESITLDFYTVLEKWDSYADTLNTWRNPAIDQLQGQALVSLKDSVVNKFKIPLELFNEWRSQNDSLNTGLFAKLNESSPEVICEFGSLSSSQIPILTYHTHTDSSATIDTVLTTRDLTIFNYDETNGTALNFPADNILVSSGVITNVLLKFNLDSLPENAVFYNTDLILTDTDISIFENPSNNSSYVIRPVEDFASEQFNPNRTVGLSADGAIVSFNGTFKTSFATDVLQEIKNGNYQNEGFLFSFLNTDEEISVKTFYGSKAEKSLAPKLIVKYLVENNQD